MLVGSLAKRATLSLCVPTPHQPQTTPRLRMGLTLRIASIGFLTWAGLFAAGGQALAQTVTLRPDADGVFVDYRLPRRATDVKFAITGVTRSDWQAKAVVLSSAGVSAKTPVDRFSLLLRPDTTEAGRGYLALTRVGAGYVLFAPALAVEGMALRLKINAPRDWTLTSRKDVSGYVYLGPKADVKTVANGEGKIIASPTVAPALREATANAFVDALAFYGNRFGTPSKQPTLIVTAQGAGPMTFRGDVTDTGVISARFHGATWTSPTPDKLVGVDKFVFHETAHIWNSHMARPREGSSWLHEGGAEYAALVGSVSTGHLSQAAALEVLSDSLTGCRRGIGVRTPGADRMRGSAAYDCGAVVQWIGDMELRRASNTKRTVLDVWADLIEKARRGQAEYGPAEFRALLAPDTAVTLLLDGPGDSRWAELENRLSALGVTWKNAPSADDLLTAVLFHLNRQNCQAGSKTGFYRRDDDIQMDNADTCGALSGKILLKTVEGQDPIKQSAAMFDIVQRRCAAAEAVTFVAVGSDAPLTASCRNPLLAPVVYRLTHGPELAAPAP